MFFPDPFYDIPIFGLDLVKVNDNVTAAIVDLSPVSKLINVELENQLYEIKMKDFTKKREIPDWGDIFSKNVFFASLTNNYEEIAFYKIVDIYLSKLLDLSKDSVPDSNQDNIQERIYFQKKYCTQQLKNEKTSSVLLKYFDKSWVDKYLKEVLFDF